MLNERYFFIDSRNKIKNAIQQRKKRKSILGLSEAVHFSSGDIVVVVFWKEYVVYRFEGICISIKKKSLSNSDVSLILRNVILGVGIEFTVSYFYNRVYNLSLSDYKRKNFIYKRSKLYFVRQRINRASRVK